MMTSGFSNIYSQTQSVAYPGLARFSSPLESVIPCGRLNNRRAKRGKRRHGYIHTSKIGRTPVLSVSEISDYFGIQQLVIKDESANRFGTHKDRKSLHVVLEAINTAPHVRPEGLCLLTAGNAGLSLATIASSYGLGITSFIGCDSIAPDLRGRLETACETVIPLDLEGRFWSSEELCRLAGAGQGRRVHDVTNGIIKPFEEIVNEICESGPEHLPDVIVLPVGGGELFLGMAQGLKNRGLKTRLIGVTVCKDSAADKLYSKWNPCADRIAALTSHGFPHVLKCLDDEQLLLDTFKWLKTSTTLECEPSSAAAFAMLHKIRNSLKPREKVMVINTGTFRFGREL